MSSLPMIWACSLAMVMIVPVYCGCHRSESATERADSRLLAPLRLRLLDVSESELQGFDRCVTLPQTKHQTISSVIHFIDYHGLKSGDHIPFGSTELLLDAVFDRQQSIPFFGKAPLRKTPFGMRITASLVENIPGGQNESHRDQFLAFLACNRYGKTGLDVDRWEDEIRNLVDDMVANFTLDQSELAWTSIALFGFANSRSWSNRFGEEFDFDQLTLKLLSKDLNSESCGGSHILQALSFIYQVDSVKGWLSRSVREACGKRLRNVVQTLITSQNHDGSWAADWNAGAGAIKADAATFPEKTLITSHLCDWLLRLPPAFLDQTAIECIRNAARWLLGSKEMIADGDSPLCPKAHVFFVLKHVCY